MYAYLICILLVSPSILSLSTPAMPPFNGESGTQYSSYCWSAKLTQHFEPFSTGHCFMEKVVLHIVAIADQQNSPSILSLSAPAMPPLHGESGTPYRLLISKTHQQRPFTMAIISSVSSNTILPPSYSIKKVPKSLRVSGTKPVQEENHSRRRRRTATTSEGRFC